MLVSLVHTKYLQLSALSGFIWGMLVFLFICAAGSPSLSLFYGSLLFSPIIGFIVGYSSTWKWGQLHTVLKFLAANVSLIMASFLYFFLTNIFVAMYESNGFIFTNLSKILVDTVFIYPIFLKSAFVFFVSSLIIFSYVNHAWIARVYAEEKLMRDI